MIQSISRVHSRLFLVTLFLIFIIASHAIADDDVVHFREFPIKDVTGMAMAENHSYLVITREDYDELLILNPESMEVEAKLPAPRPRSVICRDGAIYVGLVDKSMIRVYKKRDGKWFPEEDFPIPAGNPFLISAPSGTAFDGRIWVNAYERRIDTSILRYVIDTIHEKDTITITRNSGSDDFYVAPNGAQPDNSLSDENRKFLPYDYPEATGVFWQKQNINRWNSHLSKDDPKRFCAVPDETMPLLFYTIEEGRIVARWPDTTNSALAKRMVALPAPPKVDSQKNQSRQHVQSVYKFDLGYVIAGKHWLKTHKRDMVVYCPLAYTINQKTYFLIPDPKHQRMLYGQVEFELPENPGPKAKMTFIEGEWSPLTAATPFGKPCFLEDGKRFITPHSAENLLRIWSLSKAGHPEKIEVPKPGQVLIRGDHAYVSSTTEGKLHVVDLKSKMLTKSIDLPIERPVWLSAPGAEFFKGLILASDGGGFCLIDVNKETARQIGDRASSVGAVNAHYAASFSRDGRHILCGRRYPTEEFLNMESTRHLTGGTNTRIVEGVKGGLYISDSGYVCRYGEQGEIRIQYIGGVGIYDGFIAKDPVQEILYYYSVRNKTLTVYSHNWPFKPVATREVVVPMPASPRQQIQGVTFGGHTYLLSNAHGRVSVYRIPALFPKDSQNEQDKPLLPYLVESGKEIRVKLAEAYSSTNLELLSGPSGAVINKDSSELLWTPPKDTYGPVEFKIRSRGSDRVKIHRLETMVLGSDAIKLANQKPAPFGVNGLFKSIGHKPILINAFNGQAVLIEMDGCLVVLDPEAQTIVGFHFLETNYNYFHERDDYFLAANDERIDLLDKATLKPIRTFNLQGGRLAQFSPSPEKKFCLLIYEEESNTSPPKSTTAILDESSGQMKAMDSLPAYGTLLPNRKGGFIGLLRDNSGDIRNNKLFMINIVADRMTFTSVEPPEGTERLYPTQSDNLFLLTLANHRHKQNANEVPRHKLGYVMGSKPDRIIRHVSIESDPIMFSEHPKMRMLAVAYSEYAILFDPVTGREYANFKVSSNTGAVKSNGPDWIGFTHTGAKLITYKRNSENTFIEVHDVKSLIETE